MATSLDVTLSVQIAGSLDNPLDNTTPTQPIDYLRQVRVTNGSSTGQSSNFFEDTRSVASSTSEILNLNGGLTNAFGSSISFQRIKMLWIIASSTNTSTLTIGNSTATTFPIYGSSANVITLRANGSMLSEDSGATAYGSTNGNLMITNSSQAAGSYRIFVHGATA